MYTGNEPGLSLRNSNDCPFLCLPPGALAVSKILSPLECIRPQVHWKNDNILLEAGNLTHSRALAGDEKKTVHTYTICLIRCSSVLNIICNFFILE